MRKLFSLSVVLMVVAGMLMSACTPAATPAPLLRPPRNPHRLKRLLRLNPRKRLLNNLPRHRLVA